VPSGVHKTVLPANEVGNPEPKGGWTKRGAPKGGGIARTLQYERQNGNGLDIAPELPYHFPGMIILLGVLGLFLAQVGLFFWGSRRIIRYIEDKQHAIEAGLSAEIMHLVNEEPCQAGTVLLAIGKTVGREAGRSAKAAIFQEAGVAARMANQSADSLAVDAIGLKNPGIAGILAGMPSKQRRGIMGNPLIQLAIQGLAGSGAAAPAQQPGNNDHKSFSV